MQNVYNSDIVVCDVSAKNPNVMLELGLRLAFDKPTVIIKDDKTDYSFDTGIIEHVGYPRDLRFSKIVDFQRILASKVLATYKAAQQNPNHSPFLKNFGEFQVAALTQTEVTPDKIIINMLTEMQRDIALLKQRDDRSLLHGRPTSDVDKELFLKSSTFFDRVKKFEPESLSQEREQELRHILGNIYADPKNGEVLERLLKKAEKGQLEAIRDLKSLFQK